MAPESLDQAHHLIDHGEPGIAIEYLAIGITQQPHEVAAEIIHDLRDLAWEPTHLPSSLDDYVER